jgi:acetyl esterase/lipase
MRAAVLVEPRDRTELIGAAMRLWDDELEELRPQLREEAATFIASFPRIATTGSVEEIVADHRGASTFGEPSPRAVDRIIDGPAGPIRLRTFVPDQVDGVLFHTHGGAWLGGSPEMMDLLHEMLADTVDLAVVSVDYRLSPEHPYPAGPDDCEAAARWVIEHARADLGSDRLLIGGESAGAHLAAVTLLRLRDRHGLVDRFLGANLVFGAYDLSQTPSQRGVGTSTDIDVLDGTGFPLDLFLPGLSREERRDPDISPLYADVSDMPPALFSVGTADHLLDDTLFMASRWAAAGNETELLVYPDTPNGCIALPTVAAHFFPRLFDFCRTRLAPAPAVSSSP